MPLFGFRTSKKYDKDFTKAAEAAKVKPEKAVKASKGVAVVKARPIETTKKPPAGGPALPSGVFGNVTDAVVRPHVTEKSGILAQSNVYTFEVAANATKPSVVKAVKALYKVTPVKVAMINSPSKEIIVKGRRGTVPGVKKALVTVKQGEKIDFI